MFWLDGKIYGDWDYSLILFLLIGFPGGGGGGILLLFLFYSIFLGIGGGTFDAFF